MRYPGPNVDSAVLSRDSHGKERKSGREEGDREERNRERDAEQVPHPRIW